MKIISLFLIGLLLLTPSLVLAADRPLNPESISLPEGYKVEALATDLSVPTTAIFDGPDLLVAESGTSKVAKPRVLRIKPDGEVKVEAQEGLQEPVTGLLLINKKLYISHRTKVSVLENGQLKDIVTDLPAKGDHQNNNIALGPDGKIYLGQGTTTNSGVVGEDNYLFGWLDKYPEIHEVPCQDITLVGQNFESKDPLKNNEKNLTGAYHKFGEQAFPGEVIKGNPKCGGSIIRFNPDGSNLELVAWGLRNPFGLKFDPTGQLWATFHGADVRGSRPIFNDLDYLVKVEGGDWYGWPEYFNGTPVTDEKFHDPTKPKPEFLWQKHPQISLPYLTFSTHSATNGLAISPGGSFGFPNQIFIAEFGTFTPVTSGLNVTPAGFRVVRVNLETKQTEDFAKNILPGPAYLNQSGGLNRPSDIVFGPDQAMYIVDWGAAKISDKGLELTPQTGVIWRVYNSKTQTALRPNGPIIVPADLTSEKERQPLVRLFTLSGIRELAPILIALATIILILIGATILFKAKRLR
jgi:glucose/arabinose dehydrogenase